MKKNEGSVKITLSTTLFHRPNKCVQNGNIRYLELFFAKIQIENNTSGHPKLNGKWLVTEIHTWFALLLILLSFCVFSIEQWFEALSNKTSRLFGTCKNPPCAGFFSVSEAFLWSCSSHYRNNIFFPGSEHPTLWGIWDEWDLGPTLHVWAICVQASQVSLYNIFLAETKSLVS